MPMDVKENSSEKGWLIVVSIGAGGGIASVLLLQVFPDVTVVTIALSAIVGLLGALVYPVCAAVIVSLCERMRSWAYLGKGDKWTDRDRLGAGAFWPIALICYIIVYTFLGIIHRVFDY